MGPIPRCLETKGETQQAASQKFLVQELAFNTSLSALCSRPPQGLAIKGHLFHRNGGWAVF